MRRMIVSLAACTILSTSVYASGSDSSSQSTENSQPDATVTLTGGSVAAGVGYTWGSGNLEFRNGTHHFSIKGISIVDAGATNFSASGKVFHLQKLKDFTGNYVAAGAGIAVAGGGSALVLRNEHGVIVQLVSTEVGLKFTLSAEGVHVTVKD